VRDVFIRSLTELAAANDRILLITGDLGFGVLTNYSEKYPAQFLNAGVAEQNMTGLAAGLALDGRTVFTYSIANFPILRCLEQIRNDAAYHDANVKIVAIGGGFSYGALGMSHHATEDIAILRALPQVTVVVPGDDWETDHATRAIAASQGTCYLRLDKSSAGDTSHPGEQFELGRARTVRKGARVAVITCGGILGEVIAAADQVSGEGITPTVISMHTVSPIDRASIVEVARSHDALITVEEHGLAGGLGSAVAEVLADAGTFPKRFKRLGIEGHHYVSKVGSQDYLRRECGLDAASIATQLRQIVVG
jgi:transketolase